MHTRYASRLAQAPIGGLPLATASPPNNSSLNEVLAVSSPGYVGDFVRFPMSDAARAALKPGPNMIAVHCHQTVGGPVIDMGIVQH